MAVADTAQLVVELVLKDSMSAVGSVATGTMSRLESGAQRLGNAFGHAKSQLGGLISGPLGLIGLGGGLFGVEQIISDSISKTDTLAESVGKLTGQTGLSATAASTLIAVLGHFSIDADRTTTVVGFLEKTLGNMSKLDAGPNTSAKAGQAKKFWQEYGYDILDSTGKVKDALTTFETFSDYWVNSTASAGVKSAAAAKLFGRSYEDLIPVFNEGSKGIANIAAQADQLGLVLTDTNVNAIAKYHDAMLTMNSAIGGLELQIGMGLAPIMTEFATHVTAWVAGGGGKQVGDWFKTLSTDAMAIARTIKNDVLPIFGQIKGWWDSLPPDLQKLLVGAFVAQKASSWLFGGGGIGGVLTGLVSGGAKVAGGLVSGIQHVWVDNMGVGGMGGGIGGAVGAAAGAGEGAAAGAEGGTVAELIAGGGVVTLASAAVPIAIAAMSGAAVFALGNLVMQITGQGGPQTKPSDGTSGGTFGMNSQGSNPTVPLYRGPDGKPVYGTSLWNSTPSPTSHDTSWDLNSLLATNYAGGALSGKNTSSYTSGGRPYGIKPATGAKALAANYAGGLLSGTGPTYEGGGKPYGPPVPVTLANSYAGSALNGANNTTAIATAIKSALANLGITVSVSIRDINNAATVRGRYGSMTPS